MFVKNGSIYIKPRPKWSSAHSTESYDTFHQRNRFVFVIPEGRMSQRWAVTWPCTYLSNLKVGYCPLWSTQLSNVFLRNVLCFWSIILLITCDNFVDRNVKTWSYAVSEPRSTLLYRYHTAQSRLWGATHTYLIIYYFISMNAHGFYDHVL